MFIINKNKEYMQSICILCVVILTEKETIYCRYLFFQYLKDCSNGHAYNIQISVL